MSDEVKTVKTSRMFLLNLRDILKGLVVAIVSGGLSVVQTTLEAGQLVLSTKNIVTTAAIAGTSYLLKNVFTPQTEIKKVE